MHVVVVVISRHAPVSVVSGYDHPIDDIRKVTEYWNHDDSSHDGGKYRYDSEISIPVIPWAEKK